jgi:GNAT superfamily N-acetyltransferase
MCFDIRSIEPSDSEEVKQLFVDVMNETYFDNKIDNESDKQRMINEKTKEIDRYFVDKKGNQIYKVVSNNRKIVGIGGIFEICETIRVNLEKYNMDDLEIGSVYIRREFQGKGISKIIMRELIGLLNDWNIEKFYLDCGYMKSQNHWLKIFGEPSIRCDSYFGKDEHYMIWNIETKKAYKQYCENEKRTYQ